MSDTVGRLAQKGFAIPSPDDVEKTTAIPEQLAAWGIPSPAPTGWRSYLNGIWHWEGRVLHDTVFDERFQAKWLNIESGKRVPLVNVRREQNRYTVIADEIEWDIAISAVGAGIR